MQTFTNLSPVGGVPIEPSVHLWRFAMAESGVLIRGHLSCLSVAPMLARVSFDRRLKRSIKNPTATASHRRA